MNWNTVCNQYNSNNATKTKCTIYRKISEIKDFIGDEHTNRHNAPYQSLHYISRKSPCKCLTKYSHCF